MYPILILRCEIVCFVILLFLAVTSLTYRLESDRNYKRFNRLMAFAFAHVTFDILTVLTVNNTSRYGGSVPEWINFALHIIFYITAILFSNELANYAINLCYPLHAKKFYIAGLVATAVYLAALPFLDIDYPEDVGTRLSSGMAAYIGFGLAFIYFAIALTVLLINIKKLPSSTKYALIPMLLILIIVEISQILCRSLLFTGAAITIVTVGFFFSLENPVHVFLQKAMTDALTGVKSRSSYETDIEKLTKKFLDNPGDDYSFVFCDLFDLRGVNNRFGHAEGDNYIVFVATAISTYLKSADSIYRIGGDEFLAVYYQVDDAVILSEIHALQEKCRQTAEKKEYTPAVSVGLAKSSKNYKDLKDVVKVADYEMYQNKAVFRRNLSADANTFSGTKLNYTGLMDTVFDAMCSSNDKSYPYLTNLDTGVTRISPSWKEFFGLDAEFFSDFTGVWEQRIFPDYLEGYRADIASVINGRRKYHNFDYTAKKASGEYVKVSCHGSIYTDLASNISYFAGFLTNHSIGDNLDKLTGLENFDCLTNEVCAHIDQKKPFSVLKLKLNNIARINMLYGYAGGNEIIKKAVEILTYEAGDKGKVYCHGSVNFSILFETADKKVVENYYHAISARFAGGIENGNNFVPVMLSGGAITNNGENIAIADMRRSLIFALEESIYSQRNRLVFYDNSLNQSTATDFTLLAEIHADALRDMEHFYLRYQPITDIATRKTIGAEALLRWKSPTLGEIPPAKFIAFLENDPCYYRLGLKIIESAIGQAKIFSKKIPGFKINVNITALQLQNEDFVSNVNELLKACDFDPHCLVLELTERCKEMDTVFLSKKIEELKAYGIGVAFDDLGTGYSTINILMDIPVDEIKLDRAFVRDLQNRENYQLFVKSLVLGSAAREHQYTICFEGIEDEAMLDFVAKFGNFLGQGYYFSKPLLPEEFEELIEKENNFI